MKPLDDVDTQIAQELEKDGRASFREVARQIGVSEGTVRGRVKRMQDSGQFKFSTVLDPKVAGLECIAYVGLSVRETDIRSVTEALSAIDDFIYVAVGVGRHNVMGLVMTESRERLGRLLMDDVATMKGVTRTETMEVLEVFKYRIGRTI